MCVRARVRVYVRVYVCVHAHQVGSMGRPEAVGSWAFLELV